MTDDTDYTPAPITSGPIDGPTPDDLNAPGPSLAQTTTGEGLDTAASQTWNDLITNRLLRGAQRSDADEAPPSDAEQQSWFPSRVTPYAQPATPPPAPVSPEAANAQVKAAGATLTPFTAPVGPHALQGMIDDNLRSQKSADVIARTGDGILGGVARFGVGALVSLADPLNDIAMMIPGAPEAWTARAIEEMGGGLAARVVGQAGAGAIQGAAGMAALTPLQAAQAQADHEDFSWGDALRQTAFGAALGAGGGALHGLFSRAPDVVEPTITAALARVMQDDPRGVDVQGLLDHGEATAAQAIHAANVAEVTRVQNSPLLREAAAMREEAAQIGAPDPVAQARIDAAQEELTRPGAPPTAARTAELQAEIQSMQEGAAPPSELEMARDEAQRQGLLDAAARSEQTARDATTKAQQSAREMATRAMSQTDPELVRTQRIADQTIAGAPKLEGIADKDATEVQQMLADKKAEYDMHVANGRIVESPTAGEAGQEHLLAGKAKAAYAACGIGF